ncbi:hypothetical protein RI129_004701 [Pyrocoelia pectoralis]|uniref:Cytochrome P450 n=1 Tax=Pyrocoelia pectoralis TaxID=417401 RepID=A0AAN7ZKT6_9COLE
MAAGLMLVVVMLLSLFLQYHWKRRHLYKLSMKLPGPPALPIVGNGLSFLCRHEDILAVISSLTEKYARPVRFWLGPHLFLYFSYAEHLEKILSSTKMAHKHDIYSFVKIYLGEGLITSSGEKHKKHRKLIQPLLNAKFASRHMETFQKHINILMEKLSASCDKGTFDIHDMIHLCFADIIGESLLGMQMKSQYGQNLDYVHASADVYTVGYKRLMRPWYHPDLIYNFTSGKKDQSRIVDISYNFIKNYVIKALYRIRTSKNDGTDIRAPLVDQIADLINKDNSIMNENNFIYHMYTIYLASEDTMTIITAVLCMCFGMYPEYQKIAAEEVRSICGETSGSISYDDFSKLSYLDMCIRDVLRLIPIAPIIARQPTEDFVIDDLVIPKNCGIVISLFEVHRDPKHWENPNHFHPDHFLPEAVRTRHPFAFVPFSAGPRSCVGKVLAMFGLKLIMVNILQQFEIEGDGKFPDIVLSCDITVRSLSGYNVRLKKRMWKK